MTTRSKAAKKAAKTRAANRAQMEYFLTVTQPGYRRMQAILTLLLRLSPQPIRLRWNPSKATGRKLKHGAQYGTLVGFEHGWQLRVLPEGYKWPLSFHPAFWEVLIPDGGEARK